MALPPVKLLRPNALQIDANTPCVLEVNIPITLPHRLDPPLPAPPYHNRDGGGLPAEDFRDFNAMPLARALLAQVVSRMFGSEYTGAIVDFRPRARPFDFLLVASWECDAVTDKTSFDFPAGRWIDMYGKEGHGTIHAFMEVPDLDWIEVYHAFKYYLVRGPWEPGMLEEMNPRVLRFDVVEGSGGSSEDEIVFEVREYTEVMRTRCVNNMAVIALRAALS
ncbi:uncharacterized protein B0T15DRAFT_577978 [Chaetomium strumarium]|uniref:Uncharacterized protein n=1 Tax=Chaetomium strumarium TaxID=1170767 RepID=A0AAJ0GKP2_9PEZI|nr:hypothetical protein B0T15DRAFT_577978 [Chaetomium strumarium]